MASDPLILGRYSIGLGDRFAQQAAAQLQACRLAGEMGVKLIPVWNKSNREHLITGSEPASGRAAAAEAIRALGWTKTWHVDADHIRLNTVDRFISCSDFFTLDVADAIGQPADPAAITAFVNRHPELAGHLEIAGIDGGLKTTKAAVAEIAARYLSAVQEVGRIYRHIAAARGAGTFITEVSVDETDRPQTPLELLVILAAIADEKVPLQTIAPKFTGRFNKGVDYAGDLTQFEREFNDDLAVIRHAVRNYRFPANLKLSVHSGSDKFSIYGAIARALHRHNAGIHLKTAGTTWLEEVIGLAESDGDALALVREIYAEALDHIDDLCGPYASVIDIDRAQLPTRETAAAWSAEEFAAAVRHEPGSSMFNPHLRQLLHVGYKLAAQKGDRFRSLVRQHKEIIARNVTQNLFERHIRPVFLANRPNLR